MPSFLNNGFCKLALQRLDTDILIIANDENNGHVKTVAEALNEHKIKKMDLVSRNEMVKFGSKDSRAHFLTVSRLKLRHERTFTRALVVIQS